MNPKSLSFVTYKQSYLGTSKSLFGFVKPKHAQIIRNTLQYEKFVIKKDSSGHSFIITPPTSRLRKPINRKQLRTSLIDAHEAVFFGNLNNMNVAIIDDVQLIKPDIIRMECNYTIDEDYIEDPAIYEQLQDIYEGNEIDYSMKYMNNHRDLFEAALDIYFEDDDDDN